MKAFYGLQIRTENFFHFSSHGLRTLPKNIITLPVSTIGPEICRMHAKQVLISAFDRKCHSQRKPEP